MGGGANSSSSTSRPLTTAERFGNFAGSLASLSATAVRPEFDKAGNIINPEDVVNTGRAGIGELSAYNTPDYFKAQIVDPGNAKRLAGGDYDKLEQSLLTSRLEPLQYAVNKAITGVDEDAAKRGVWSSGLALQGKSDVLSKVAPELRAIAGDASAARLLAEQGDNNTENSYNLNRAQGLNQGAQFDSAQRNSFEMENANRRYNAGWAPANYLAGVYNGTGGQVSNGSGGGWNFNI